MSQLSSTAKKLSREDKIRQWKLSRGAHKLKNRSSKSILSISHYNPNKIWRTFSRQALAEMSKNGCWDADMELARRNSKAARKAAKGQQ